MTKENTKQTKREFNFATSGQFRTLALFLVRSCLLITLIKCLKGHKSLGSLCSVVKTLIVSGVRRTNQPSKGQGHLLTCSGQLKTMTKCQSPQCHELNGNVSKLNDLGLVEEGGGVILQAFSPIQNFRITEL